MYGNAKWVILIGKFDCDIRGCRFEVYLRVENLLAVPVMVLFKMYDAKSICHFERRNENIRQKGGIKL